MRIRLIAFAILVTLVSYGTASANVQIYSVVFDGPGGQGGTVIEERPVTHSLSRTLNATSVSAAGDLSTGILRAVAITRRESATNPFDNSFAVMEVNVSDRVTFAQGANGTAYLDWGFDGSIDVEPNKPRQNYISAAYLNFQVTPPSGSISGARLATVTTGIECSGASAPNCVTGPFPHAEVTMRGSVPFEIHPGTFALGFTLGAGVKGGDSAHFGNTSYLYLRVPAGVIYTSGSGVFLANAVPVPPPVPEPATALLIAFGGLALVATQRWAARTA